MDLGSIYQIQEFIVITNIVASLVNTQRTRKTPLKIAWKVLDEGPTLHVIGYYC